MEAGSGSARPWILPGLALCLWALIALAASPSPSQGVPQLWCLANYGVVYALVVNGFYTAAMDLKELLEKQILVAEGMGRGRCYRLVLHT